MLSVLMQHITLECFALVSQVVLCFVIEENDCASSKTLVARVWTKIQKLNSVAIMLFVLLLLGAFLVPHVVAQSEVTRNCSTPLSILSVTYSECTRERERERERWRVGMRGH